MSETFEQRLEHESVFGVDEKGPIRFTYEEYDAFKAGANWCREQMQAEIDGLRQAKDAYKAMYEERSFELQEERAKAQKLYDLISGTGDADLEAKADEAIKEYRGKK